MQYPNETAPAKTSADTYSKVAYLSVTEDTGAGQRIDNYLVGKLKGVPKSKIYSILRKGEVRVNKGRIKPSYKLQVDDIVRVPPMTTNTNTELQNITAAQLASFDLNDTILYEDDNLLVLNKPAGLAVHGGSGLKFGLIELIRALRPQDTGIELVHRLDRDTSGCIMLAKKPKMLRALHSMLRNGEINKTYHALVKGYVAGDFIVDEPLKKFSLESGERMVKINKEEGQPSITEYVLLERYPGMSLMQATPITGRTHQIRVHAVHRGFPIIGDDKYGNKNLNQSLRKTGFKRMFLHARQLEFTCPITGKHMQIVAEYDKNWNTGIDTLTQGNSANDRRKQLMGTSNDQQHVGDDA